MITRQNWHQQSGMCSRTINGGFDVYFGPICPAIVRKFSLKIVLICWCQLFARIIGEKENYRSTHEYCDSFTGTDQGLRRYFFWNFQMNELWITVVLKQGFIVVTAKTSWHVFWMWGTNLEQSKTCKTI